MLRVRLLSSALVLILTGAISSNSGGQCSASAALLAAMGRPSREANRYSSPPSPCRSWGVPVTTRSCT